MATQPVIIQFSESAATTAFLNAGQIEFLPLADFNGSLRYKVFARSIETDGQMSESAVVTATQTFEKRVPRIPMSSLAAT